MNARKTQSKYERLPSDDQVALVTGATRGIGRAIAITLAEAEASLML